MNVPELKSLHAHRNDPIVVADSFILQDTALIGLYTAIEECFPVPKKYETFGLRKFLRRKKGLLRLELSRIDGGY